MSENQNVALVELSEYNPEWSRMFEGVKNELMPIIGDCVTSIEHIGSTAILNLSAKPEIDILVGVYKLEDIDKCIEPLCEAGYPYYKRFEEFVPNRRYFRKSKGIIPLVHVHVYEIRSREYKDHVAFRDYMRNHPEAVKEYENLKKELLKTSLGDRGMYQNGKINFIKRIIEINNKKNDDR